MSGLTETSGQTQKLHLEIPQEKLEGVGFVWVPFVALLPPPFVRKQ